MFALGRQWCAKQKDPELGSAHVDVAELRDSLTPMSPRAVVNRCQREKTALG